MFKKSFELVLQTSEKLLWITKQVRRPMTFYTLVTFPCLYMIWSILQIKPEALSIIHAVAIVSLCSLIAAICVLVYKWGKAKLEENPDNLSDTSNVD